MTEYAITKVPQLPLIQLVDMTGDEDVHTVQLGIDKRTKSINYLNDVEASLTSTSNSKQLAASQGKILNDKFNWLNSADGLIFSYATLWTLTPSTLDVIVTIPACEISEINSGSPTSTSGTSGTIKDNGGLVLTKTGAIFIYSFVDDLTTIVEGADLAKWIIVKNIDGNLYTRIPSIAGAVDQSSTEVYPFPAVEISTDLSPALPRKSYLVDASGGIVSVELPDVIAGNYDAFYIQLKTDGNHAQVTTVGGVQLIDDEVLKEIPTTNTGLLVKANGVDGYDIISDERLYYRGIPITISTDLSNGYESGGVYNCNPAPSTEITITIPDPCIEHKGFYAKFILDPTSTGTVRVITDTGLVIGDTTDQLIITPSKGFEVYDTGTAYLITQSSRPSSQQSSLTLYGLEEASPIGGVYKRASTNTTDPDYSGTPVDLSTGTVAGTQLVATFASDEGVVQGIIPETDIFSIMNWQKVSGSANALAYAEVYKRATGGSETLIATTSSTATITSATYVQYTVSALLAQQTFISTDRVVIKVYMTVVGGGSAPTYELLLEGTNPFRLTINLPASTIAHDTLPGVNDAGIGINKGHVNEALYKIIFPSKVSEASSATPTPTGDYTQNEYYATALAINTVIQAPSGTPINGNTLFGRIYSAGSYTIGLNSIYNDITGNFPTSTIATKELYFGAVYNSRNSKWDITSWIISV